MRSAHIFAAAEALRKANAAQETGALSDPEDAARVLVLAFLRDFDTTHLQPAALSWHNALIAEASREDEFYVWVFAPSAVRTGWQVGVFHSNRTATIETWIYETRIYDAGGACEQVWSAVSAVATNPRFFTSNADDAPISADLVERLNKRALKREIE